MKAICIVFWIIYAATKNSTFGRLAAGRTGRAEYQLCAKIPNHIWKRRKNYSSLSLQLCVSLSVFTDGNFRRDLVLSLWARSTPSCGKSIIFKFRTNTSWNLKQIHFLFETNTFRNWDIYLTDWFPVTHSALIIGSVDSFWKVYQLKLIFQKRGLLKFVLVGLLNY